MSDLENRYVADVIADYKKGLTIPRANCDVPMLLDEIERLTAELKVWRPNTASEGHGCPACGREYTLEEKLQARVEQLEGVYDAVQNLSYADAVSGAEQWVDLREAMAAATEHGYGAWTCDCGKVNPETMHGCLACGFKGDT